MEVLSTLLGVVVAVLPPVAGISTVPSGRRGTAGPILWETRLPGSGRIDGPGLRRGNGVVVAPSSASGGGGRRVVVYATTDEGTLHALDSAAGEEIFAFEPKRWGDWTTECRSSVSLHLEGGGSTATNGRRRVVYAVYAVIDVPYSRLYGPQSRIIAVNADGSLRWSTKVDGVAVGTPLIGRDGEYVYINHNVGVEEEDNDGASSAPFVTSRTGVLSVLRDSSGGGGTGRRGRVVDQKFASEHGGREAPFGPLALSPSGVAGGGVDALYWGESWEGGTAEKGRMYEYIRHIDTFSILFESDWSIDAPPTLGRARGDRPSKLWIGARKSRVYGWTEGSFEDKPTWKRGIDRSSRNVDLPIPNRIVATNNLLFVASASTSFHCLDAKTGDKVWSEKNGASVYLNEARLSPDETKVYAIRHDDGTVTQHDAKNGEIMWQYNCREVTRNRLCQSSVEAEFSLSTDGSVLYYGDILGRIMALDTTATFYENWPTFNPTPTPTIQPTDAPAIDTSLIQIAAPPETPPPTYPIVSSSSPTTRPTHRTTSKPTINPTVAPSAPPSTVAPTHLPSLEPSSRPSGYPVSPIAAVWSDVVESRYTAVGLITMVVMFLAAIISCLVWKMCDSSGRQQGIAYRGSRRHASLAQAARSRRGYHPTTEDVRPGGSYRPTQTTPFTPRRQPAAMKSSRYRHPGERTNRGKSRVRRKEQGIL